MEYGASAEDVARVCHAHPVSHYVMEGGGGGSRRKSEGEGEEKNR